jgi:6-phosphofructokinase 1
MAGAQSISAQGYPVVGIPGTIDNDVYGTDTCIGVDTALNTIMEAIDKIRDTAASHSRAFLVQTMGRDSGFLAVESALISGAEMALIPENPNITVEEIAQTIANSYKRGRRHCIIVVAEGFPIPMDELTVKLDAMDLGFKARGTNLSYIQRGGTPSAFDRLIASRMGFKAIEFLTTGKFNVMTALQGRDIVPLPIPELVGKHRGFPEEYLKISNILSR